MQAARRQPSSGADPPINRAAVDLLDFHQDPVRRQVIGYGTPAGFPRMIVVDDDVAARSHAGIQIVEDVDGRAVQVAVQAKQGQPIDRCRWQTLGKPSRNEADLVVEESKSSDVLLDILERDLEVIQSAQVESIGWR